MFFIIDDFASKALFRFLFRIDRVSFSLFASHHQRQLAMTLFFSTIAFLVASATVRANNLRQQQNLFANVAIGPYGGTAVQPGPEGFPETNMCFVAHTFFTQARASDKPEFRACCLIDYYKDVCSPLCCRLHATYCGEGSNVCTPGSPYVTSIRNLADFISENCRNEQGGKVPLTIDVKVGPMKDIVTAYDKIMNRKPSPVSALTDILRASYIVESEAYYDLAKCTQQALEHTFAVPTNSEQGFRLVRYKNRVCTAEEYEGYADMLLNLEFTHGGITTITELQLMTKDMYEAKSGHAHADEFAAAFVKAFPQLTTAEAKTAFSGHDMYKCTRSADGTVSVAGAENTAMEAKKFVVASRILYQIALNKIPAAHYQALKLFNWANELVPIDEACPVINFPTKDSFPEFAEWIQSQKPDLQKAVESARKMHAENEARGASSSATSSGFQESKAGLQRRGAVSLTKMNMFAGCQVPASEHLPEFTCTIPGKGVTQPRGTVIAL